MPPFDLDRMFNYNEARLASDDGSLLLPWMPNANGRIYLDTEMHVSDEWLREHGIMPDLYDQIRNAWKNGTSKEFIRWVPLTGWLPTDSQPLSANCIQFGQVWQVTLHYNNCTGGCNDRCKEGAAGLVKSRLECISRGMPDLDHDTEQNIWKTAFEIHRGHSDRGVITPTWSETWYEDRCDCFEKAMERYNKSREQTVLLAAAIKIDPEELHYEPRYE